jgi:maltose alpha-D-glucosyltransferase / alpha-amylase
VIQNDFAIIDFEGEPMRSLAERRSKGSPLADVAGMLRSFAYAAASGVRQMTEIQPAAADALRERGEDWRREVAAAFLERYRAVMAATPSYPVDPEAAEAVLAFFMLEKALNEIAYELANRPTWAGIPIAAALAMIEQSGR